MRTPIEIRKAKQLNARRAKRLRNGIGVIYTDDSGKQHHTITESDPWKLGDGTWVVKLNQHTGGINCSRVVPGVFQFKPHKKKTADGGEALLTNGEKAALGNKLLNQHALDTGNKHNERITQLADMLADLLHLCDKENVWFYGALQTAEKHWNAER